MSRLTVPAVSVGNEFVASRPKQPVAPAAVVTAELPAAAPLIREMPLVRYSFEVPERYLLRPSLWQRLADKLQAHRFAALALLCLCVGSAVTLTGGQLIAARLTPQITVRRAQLPSYTTGPNAIVTTRELNRKLQTITSQPLNIKIGGETASLTAATTKTWIKVVNDKARGVSYLHLDAEAVVVSLDNLVKANTIAAVNEVRAAQADGSTIVIAKGKTGKQPQADDTAELVRDISQHYLAGKGMQLELPVRTVNFATVTPAAFNKLLEVNVNTKQMYAYERGQLVKTFAISAGTTETPTPLGQYKIYHKLTVQDMRGYNPDGSRYYQPHVRWINYFLPGGYAVHGNYWRPLDWFGSINSSHGCVSLPDDQAKWVYDWAPIGTTVITHG